MDTPNRIMSDDTRRDALSKLVENNPGAMMAVMGLMQHAEARGLNPMLPLLQLDSAGVYGSSIWMLHKDVCGQVSSKVANVLGAWQRGDISSQALHHAIQNRGVGVPPWALDGGDPRVGTRGLAKPAQETKEAPEGSSLGGR